MATPRPASASIPIFLCGSKPGVFDPTQPLRLLRYPSSTLHFASFNPLTDGGPSPSADALTRARRVVVEVPAANDITERPNWFSFVPDAVLAPGVASEGKWPRVVNYCGRYVVCDQDQWDIHKLDPLYNCVVPTAGLYPTISKKTSVSAGAPNPAVSSTFTGDLASGASSTFFLITTVPPTASSAPSGPPFADDRTPQTDDEQFAASGAVALSPLRQAQAAHPAHPLLELERLRRRHEHHQEWMPWTRRLAMDRYLVVSEQFDNARFSYENPVDPFFIPWPVLQQPSTFELNQVDWEMVQPFFDEAARQMTLEDYKQFMLRTQKRFNLDRSRVRGVFKTHDSGLAQALERAFIRVLQVVNPICDKCKGKY